MTKMSNVNNVEEQDILEKFRTAVRNGQTRLALEALVDVVDAIVEIIAPAEEVAQTEQPVENNLTEEKPVAKKKTKEDQSVTTTVK
jgi:hypothetical protein